MTRVRIRAMGFAGVGIVFLAVLMFGAAACGNDTGTSNSQPTTTSGLAFVVTISDNKFTPSSLAVPAGTTIVWRWTGNNSHAVVGSFGSDQVQSPTHKGSGSFSYTFTAPGTYDYHCAIHGAAMAAKVIVK